MYRSLLLVLAAAITLACEPDWEPYEIFVIPEGEHSKNFPLQMLQSETLSFTAIFDESAIYESETPENQWDTNKLLGFADCNSHHHENSARFGWRWVDGELEILAYCYAAGVRTIQLVGYIPLNTPSHFSISLTDQSYIFALNDNEQVEMTRNNSCNKGLYYMLFPYFGGDEVAPHDISIQVKFNY